MTWFVNGLQGRPGTLFLSQPQRACLPLLAILCCIAGCKPEDYRLEADKVAYGIVDEAQRQALGKVEPFTVEPPADTLRKRLLLDQNLPRSGPESLGFRHLPRIAHWPEEDYPPAPETQPAPLPQPVILTLVDSLQVAAANNRDYQSRKEDLFRAALTLDLQANQFRNLWDAALSSDYLGNRRGDDPVRGLTNTTDLSWRRRLANGTLLTADFAVDLANLLSADRASSWGVLGDATINVPLLRGSGRHIVQEPLTQAERDVVYSLFTFERFKSVLVVRVASDYLGALQQLDQVTNAEENYRGLIVSTRRALNLYAAGRLPQIQVDQARQDELRARDRWISAEQAYIRSLDTLKGTLGLPTDAEIKLDRNELESLTGVAVGEIAATQPVDSDARADDPVELTPVDPRGGPLELDGRRAIEIALANRLDLQTALGQVYDAQRKVVVAADSLQAELTLTGSASVGERRSGTGANQPDAEFRVSKGLYAAGVLLDLPLERTAERNDYRNSLINMERALRSAQALEDQVKLEIRNNLRSLLSARESYKIQLQAVEIAQRRVQSTALFLEAGRAEIRDVLDAQEALISAKNSLTSAKVTYRLAELGMQRDMGVLQVDEKGIWREYTPETTQ